MGFLDFVADAINFNTGGVMDTLSDACKITTNRAMANTDAEIERVETGWTPTGFYTPEQMRQVVLFVLGMRNTSREALITTSQAGQLEAHLKFIADANDALSARALDAKPYSDAIAKAEAQGAQVIKAEGFKRWVVANLRAARDAKFAAVFVDCARPGFLIDTINAINNAVDKVIAVVKAIVQVAVTAAQAAGAAVVTVVDLLGSFVKFIKVAPWVLLLGGGYYVAAKHRAFPPKYDPLKIADRTAGRETFRPWRHKAG